MLKYLREQPHSYLDTESGSGPIQVSYYILSCADMYIFMPAKVWIVPNLHMIPMFCSKHILYIIVPTDLMSPPPSTYFRWMKYGTFKAGYEILVLASYYFENIHWYPLKKRSLQKCGDETTFSTFLIEKILCHCYTKPSFICPNVLLLTNITNFTRILYFKFLLYNFSVLRVKPIFKILFIYPKKAGNQVLTPW